MVAFLGPRKKKNLPIFGNNLPLLGNYILLLRISLYLTLIDLSIAEFAGRETNSQNNNIRVKLCNVKML